MKILLLIAVNVLIKWFYVPVFVILGHHYEHLGLMIAMEEMKLFVKGLYIIVAVFLYTQKYFVRIINSCHPQKTL